jgi:hypothetical protein
MLKLDSHVSLPRSKKSKRDNERRRKIFEAFRKVYKALYVIEPAEWTYDTFTRFMTIRAADGRVLERAGEARVKELTRMYRDRLAIRGT